MKNSKNEENNILEIFNGKSMAGIISSKGRHARISEDDIKSFSYKKTNNLLINLNDDEYINEVVPLIEPVNYSFINN